MKPSTSKTKLLDLLERNPPALFTALSSAIDDGDFNDTAISTANDVSYLMAKINKMTVYEINLLYRNVQQYLN